MKKDISIYIHIPFCQKKCPYCHFFSCDDKNYLISDYLNALSQEIQFYTRNWEFSVKTIYIGGGTPSILNIIQLKELFTIISKHFLLTKDIEITFEANPKSLTRQKLKYLKSAGVNRLSIGAQSFDNKELKTLGRLHSAKDINTTFKNARDAGFRNINIDLIFAIPQQTSEYFLNTLEHTINLSPEHISLYNLTIDEGCKWFNNKNIILPDNDIDFEIYQKSINFLKSKKYIHYEISNFSKYGYQCRHNLTYWENEDYIGMGSGAHSFFMNKRYSHNNDLLSYIKNPLPLDIINNFPDLSENNKIQESMFLNLRILKGLNIENFKKQFHYSPDYYFPSQIKELKNLKLIKETNNHIKLTRKGLYLANEVFEKFV